MRKSLFGLNDRFLSTLLLTILLLYIVMQVYIYGRLSDTTQWVFSVVFIIFLTDGLKIVVESFLSLKLLIGDEDLSQVTVIIPTYNGGSTLSQTLSDLVKRFPAEQIIVSSNGSTDDSVEIAKRFGVQLLEIPNPVGKVRAINIALGIVKTRLVLIIDDDVLIKKAKIPTSLLTVNSYEAVAFRVLPEKGNWLTRFQMHEYRKSMDIGRGFHNATASVQNVSGAIGLFKTFELRRQIKLHSGEFSGEDLQRTLLVHLDKHSQGVVICSSIVRTVVPDTPYELLNQRVYGWYPGFLGNTLNLLKVAFKKKVPLRFRYEGLYSVLFVVALDPLRLLSFPFLILSWKYSTTLYATYLLFEAIPYFRMGAKDPLWVLLLYPIYGVFNQLTRSIGLFVFFYRRLVYRLGKLPHYDDFRLGTVFHKAVAMWIVSMTVGAIMTGYVYAATPEKTVFNEYEALAAIALIRDQWMFNEIKVSQEDPYEFVVYDNQSLWDTAYLAILQYQAYTGEPITFSEAENAATHLIELHGEEPIKVGNVVTFRKEFVRSAFYRAKGEK